MEDPLYLLKSYGLMSNTMTESPYVGNYTQLLLIGSGGNGYTYGETTNDISNFNGKILVTHNASEVPGISNAKGAISEVDGLGSIGKPYVINASATSLIPLNISVLIDGINGKVWYIDNFKKHVENSYYQSSQYGASYLDRLEGRTEIHPKYNQLNRVIGLESFINKAEIPPEITVDEGKTNTDYLYFSSGSFNVNKVKGVSTDYNWFKIDNETSMGNVGHQVIYNVAYLIE
jgi:hypothetical protein